MVSPYPALDLLLLTYNCAKSPIQVPVFAAHLHSALAGHAASSASSATNATVTSLPDVVVFSLQEAAPLGHAFAGSYFLSPYLARFDDALNQAATLFEAQKTPVDEDDDEQAEVERDEHQELLPSGSGSGSGTATPAPAAAKLYQFVRHANVGMTAILLFARDPAAIRSVQVAECGFGVADMGNKGAVGLRVAYASTTSTSAHPVTELTFVATHLAAMEWNVRRRNANWRSIMAGLTFGNPRDVLTASSSTNAEATAALRRSRNRQGRTRDSAASTPRTPEEEEEAAAAEAAGDDAWLLLGHQSESASAGAGPNADADAAAASAAATTRSPSLRRRLQDISIFRRDSLLFVGGDLNYRIDAVRPPMGAPFPTPDTWPDFLERDQLSEEQRAGRTFHGMHEAPIAFPPTYKYDVLGEPDDAAAVAEAVNAAEIAAWQAQHPASDSPAELALAPLPWRYAQHRWPSWCDRILYLDVPARMRRRWRQQSGQKGEPRVQVTAYKSLPLMRTSDHQPVFLRARVPLLGSQRGEEEREADAHVDAEAEMDGADDGMAAAVAAGGDDTTEEQEDPREHLPVPIDMDAWQRREQARRREVMAGCGMLLFNTPTGALAVATVVLVVVGTYWVWVGMAQGVAQ